ncbi:hypothetical protein [Actinosynnema sp. NPDC023587]
MDIAVAEPTRRSGALHPDEPPDHSKTGHLWRRLDHLLFTDLCFSYGQ